MTIDNHWSIKLNEILGLAPLNQESLPDSVG